MTTTAGADPRVGVLRTAGLEVATRTEGEGEPLLLLNGLTRPYDSWAPLVAALPGRRIVTFDVPGVGASPPPAAPLSIPTLARLATAVMDAAGVGIADVLGFSHGGLVAQQLAIAAPQRLRRLALAATSCGVGATPGSYPYRRDFVPFEGAGLWPAPDSVAMLGQLFAVGTWSSIPFLGAIRLPTLVVQGSHDRLVPPENSTMLARRIVGARLVTLPAGHDLQRADVAPMLAHAVQDFLRNLP